MDSFVPACLPACLCHTPIWRRMTDSSVTKQCMMLASMHCALHRNLDGEAWHAHDQLMKSKGVLAERALSDMVTTAERRTVRKEPYLRHPRRVIALRTSAALGASACITPKECVTFLLSVRATP